MVEVKRKTLQSLNMKSLNHFYLRMFAKTKISLSPVWCRRAVSDPRAMGSRGDGILIELPVLLFAGVHNNEK